VKTQTAERRLAQPFLSIHQLRSKIPDFGHGNFATARRLVDIISPAGIRAITILPINETEPHLLSPFSKSSFTAVSTRLLSMSDVPEIERTPALRRQLESDLATASLLNGDRIHAPTVDKMHRYYLNEAHNIFLNDPPRSVRRKNFNEYCERYSWSVEPYSHFSALADHLLPMPMEFWDEAYADPESSKSKTLFRNATMKKLREYYKFSQFEADRQARGFFGYAHDNGIEEIELLMGIGVTRISAEAFMMRDIFDRTRQIGCLPEPDNGFPIQFWGFAAMYMDNPAAIDFLVKCFQYAHELGADRLLWDHGAGLFGGFYYFPLYRPGTVENGSPISLDKDNKDDERYGVDSHTWACTPGTELAHAEKVMEAILDRMPNIRMAVETMGDNPRRIAAEHATELARKKGQNVTSMAPFRCYDAKTHPTLHSYRTDSRLSITHDEPSVTAMLTGRIEDHIYEWIDGKTVKGILNRLGILAPQLNLPIDINQITPEFMFEIFRRLTCGSNAGTVVFPLAGLLTMDSRYTRAGKILGTNHQPGEQGVVDPRVNTKGNFAFRMPEVEVFDTLTDKIRIIAERKPDYFDTPFDISPVAPIDGFSCQARKAGSSVAYQANDGKWTVWTPDKNDRTPLFELAVSYSGGDTFGGYENKAWARYSLANAGIDPNTRYTLEDLLGNVKPLFISGWNLIEGLPIGLSPHTNRHHFIIS